MLLDLFKPKDPRKKSFHHLRKRLHGHHARAVSHLHAAHGHVAHLTKKHGVHIHKLRHHGQRAAATAVLSTSLLASIPAADLAKHRLPSVGAQTAAAQDAGRLPEPEEKKLPDKPVQDALKEVVGDKPSPNFNAEQEAAVSQIFADYYGIKAHGELEGKRLNVVYGQMGGEQHLKRYPGDVAANHKNNIDTRPELAGIAPGLGGWGYFAPSKAAFDADKDAYEREKFYIAAQTFAAPGWKENVMGMSRWFKFRKMLVVNPNTGQAVVAVIGDAGPGLSTKKSFGGSPEVMDAVGHSRGSRRGPVIVYFIDDPENKIPLGHIAPGDYLK